MRKLRIGGTIAGIAIAALALTACNSGTPGDDTKSTDKKGGADSSSSSTPWKVATGVSVSGSPTFDAIKSRGKVVFGVKEDQPNLGFKDAATGDRTGFDIDMARWIAASLGYAEKDITFVAVPSANREQAIINGDVDFVVGTYSITDKRKQVIDFAGPYFVTGQGLLVRKDDDSIKSENDLKGKTVCSATGSTPLQNIQQNFPDTKAIGLDVYSACVDQLLSKKVDAVTTDQAILLGYAAQDPDQLKVVGKPFTTERYGIGLKKGDTAMRAFLNTMLTDGHEVWQKIYDQDLGKTGIKVDQPAVDQ